MTFGAPEFQPAARIYCKQRIGTISLVGSVDPIDTMNILQMKRSKVLFHTLQHWNMSVTTRNVYGANAEKEHCYYLTWLLVKCVKWIISERQQLVVIRHQKILLQNVSSSESYRDNWLVWLHLCPLLFEMLKRYNVLTYFVCRIKCKNPPSMHIVRDCYLLELVAKRKHSNKFHPLTMLRTLHCCPSWMQAHEYRHFMWI